MCRNSGSVHATACVFPLPLAGPGTNLLSVLPSAVVLWQHLGFLNLYSKISNVVCSAPATGAAASSSSGQKHAEETGFGYDFGGTGNAAPHFIARKPVEDDILVVQQNISVVFLVAPSWRAPSCCCVRSQVSSFSDSSARFPDQSWSCDAQEMWRTDPTQSSWHFFGRTLHLFAVPMQLPA